MYVCAYVHSYVCISMYVCVCVYMGVCVNVPSYSFSIVCFCSACSSPPHLLESRQMFFPSGHLLRLSGLISEPIAHGASPAC